MGAEGLAARPADASSGEVGEASSDSRAVGLSLAQPSLRPHLPTALLAQDPQRSEKDVRWPPQPQPQPRSLPATSQEG